MKTFAIRRPSENLGCLGIIVGRLYFDIDMSKWRVRRWFPSCFVAWNLNQHGTEYTQFAFRFWFWWTGFRGEVYHVSTPTREAYVSYPRSKGMGRRLRNRVADAIPLPLFLYQRFSRRQWTANPADPTQVVEWRWRANRSRPFRHDRLVLLASWAVEARVTLFGKCWTVIDAPLCTWLFDKLEDQYNSDMFECEPDPMGRLSDYE